MNAPTQPVIIDEFVNRLRKRIKHLKKWARRRDISCYRVYEKDLPDQPLIIDFYDGDVVAWTFSRTRDETESQQRQWIDSVCASILTAFDIDQSHFFLKTRGRQRGLSQYEKNTDSDYTHASAEIRTVTECGHTFEINLSDYLDIGLFLDHRPLRHIIRDTVADKDFLNLFAYTGSFTAYAAVAGARSTHSIDLSYTYLEWLQRNLSLNGISDNDIADRHTATRGDCIQELKKIAASDKRFDIIVCDPPTFSNSKSNSQDFIVQEQHVELLQLCKKILTADGVIYFSTNFRQFRMSDEILNSMQVTDITAASIPEDFRNQKIHYCWDIR